MKPHPLSPPYWVAAFAIAYGIQLAFIYQIADGWPTSSERWLRDLLTPFSPVWILYVLPTFGLLVLILVGWPKRIFLLWPVVIVACILVTHSCMRLSKA